MAVVQGIECSDGLLASRTVPTVPAYSSPGPLLAHCRAAAVGAHNLTNLLSQLAAYPSTEPAGTATLTPTPTPPLWAAATGELRALFGDLLAEHGA